MKGIILAGGSGARLYPTTKGISKQLVPVYDKPMIYYPISVLMLAGIREILIITNLADQAAFKRLLGDGSELGLKFEYIIQPSPDGLTQAFILGEEFIGRDSVCLILGDNIFYGDKLATMLLNGVDTAEKENISTVFGYRVSDPEQYGVAEFDSHSNVINLEEKPDNPKSNYAVTGIYFYPNDVIKKAKNVKYSDRGELEITTLNQQYLEEGRLRLKKMGRGFAWLDTGTHENLLEASNYIGTIEKRQGMKVACLEEIAFELNYITKQQLIKLAQPLLKNQYGKYLLYVAEGKTSY